MGDNEAVAMACRLARNKGTLGGFPAGANLVAARISPQTCTTHWTHLNMRRGV
jgi:cysteine synthase